MASWRIWDRRAENREVIGVRFGPASAAQPCTPDVLSLEPERARATERRRVVVFGASHADAETPYAAHSGADEPTADRALYRRRLGALEIDGPSDPINPPASAGSHGRHPLPEPSSRDTDGPRRVP